MSISSTNKILTPSNKVSNIESMGISPLKTQKSQINLSRNTSVLSKIPDHINQNKTGSIFQKLFKDTQEKNQSKKPLYQLGIVSSIFNASKKNLPNIITEEKFKNEVGMKLETAQNKISRLVSKENDEDFKKIIYMKKREEMHNVVEI